MKDNKINIFEQIFFESFKKYLGLNNKDVIELKKFIEEFEDAMNDSNPNNSYIGYKSLVDVSNKIPSHAGFLIIQYYIEKNGIEKYYNLIIHIFNTYQILLVKLGSKNSIVVDSYEMLATLILFSTEESLRNFIKENFEISKNIYYIMIKRPCIISVMSARYSELFLTSNYDIKYAEVIFNIFDKMIKYLYTFKDISTIEDPVLIHFDNLYNIMEEFVERSNKESLKKLNRLINKKADVGESFFYWIALNSSCAIEVILKYDNFNYNFIKNFLYQMNDKYLLEITLMLKNLPIEKFEMDDYLKNTYNIIQINDCLNILTKSLNNQDISHYGILFRQKTFFREIDTENNENLGEIANILQLKLSAIANNLTADISNSSMSITIASVGRSREFQNLVDRIEGNFEKKLAVYDDETKNLPKQIREGESSYYVLDQICGFNIIKILQIIIDYYKNKSNSVDSNLSLIIKNKLNKKYGIIFSEQYIKDILNELTEKRKISEDDILLDF